ENSGFEPYPYDPEAAKKLLAASTYGGPERLPKILFFGISGPAIQAAAQFIADQRDRQNDRIIGIDQRLHSQPAETRQAEDELDEDR
ncbi:hypothetical protein ACC809_36595, partial [Rhizobium johnstonii]